MGGRSDSERCESGEESQTSPPRRSALRSRVMPDAPRSSRPRAPRTSRCSVVMPSCASVFDASCRHGSLTGRTSSSTLTLHLHACHVNYRHDARTTHDGHVATSSRNVGARRLRNHGHGRVREDAHAHGPSAAARDVGHRDRRRPRGPAGLPRCGESRSDPIPSRRGRSERSRRYYGRVRRDERAHDSPLGRKRPSTIDHRPSPTSICEAEES